jgi:hypothetical protein
VVGPHDGICAMKMKGRSIQLRLRRTLALLVSVVILCVPLVGCQEKEDMVATPQRFVYDYEAKKAVASSRQAMRIELKQVNVGTMFPVRILRSLSSKTALVGDTFPIEVLEDVTVDGVVVIPVGSGGQGRVIEATPAKTMGKAGRLRVAVEFVCSYDGAVVPVEANEQTAARDEEVVGKTVLWYVFVGPLGLLSLLEKGQDVVVPADSQFYVMVRSQAVVNGRVY